MTEKYKAKNNQTLNYKESGVDVQAGYELVERIKPLVSKTKRPEILSGLGSFSALSRIPKDIENPILVTCTDGVGTKIDIAQELKKFDSIGIDLVAMCVNDLIACGAEPLLFLDYYVTDKLKVDTAAEVIKGIAEGCLIAGCSLVGGETAEHPGSFPDNTFDLAGFSVGIVDENKIIGANGAAEGDVLVGLSSSGIHSNGFSLIRKILKESKINLQDLVGGESLGNQLLFPTKIYVKEILSLKNKVNISAISHITGGGFYENIPRILNENITATIDFSFDDWPARNLYNWIASKGIKTKDMLSTFNCGVGMVIAIPPEDTNIALSTLNSDDLIAKVIGSVHKKLEDEEEITINF
jgi:phosphoribosylformylglycinamidine cyclo-ligase